MVTSTCCSDSRRFSRTPAPYQAPYRHGRRLSSSGHGSRAGQSVMASDGDAESDSNHQPVPRKRISVACGRCRKRKIRCSGDPGNGLPCQNCKNAGAEVCQFLRVASQMADWKINPEYSYNVDTARSYHVRSPIYSSESAYANGTAAAGASSTGTMSTTASLGSDYLPYRNGGTAPSTSSASAATAAAYGYQTRPYYTAMEGMPMYGEGVVDCNLYGPHYLPSHHHPSLQQHADAAVAAAAYLLPIRSSGRSSGHGTTGGGGSVYLTPPPAAGTEADTSSYAYGAGQAGSPQRSDTGPTFSLGTVSAVSLSGSMPTMPSTHRVLPSPVNRSTAPLAYPASTATADLSVPYASTAKIAGSSSSSAATSLSDISTAGYGPFESSVMSVYPALPSLQHGPDQHHHNHHNNGRLHQQQQQHHHHHQPHHASGTCGAQCLPTDSYATSRSSSSSSNTTTTSTMSSSSGTNSYTPAAAIVVPSHQTTGAYRLSSRRSSSGSSSSSRNSPATTKATTTTAAAAASHVSAPAKGSHHRHHHAVSRAAAEYMMAGDLAAAAVTDGGRSPIAGHPRASA